MKILDRIKNFYMQHFISLEEQAKKVGVRIGENNFVDSKFWSTEPYLITIGNNCQITGNVHFFTHGGGQSVRHIDPKFDCFGKIEIGDYVYIGNGSLIMPGVTVGNHVLIAAGSVVTKSIPSDVVVGGNPAKVICSIYEYYERNKIFNLRTKGLSHTEKRILLESLSSEMFIKKGLT